MQVQRILIAASLALAAGAAQAHASIPCDGLDRDIVSRSIGRTMVRLDPQPAYEQARYAVYACDWKAEGKDNGLLAVVVRDAADERKNAEDLRLLQQMAPYARGGSQTQWLVGLGEHAHYTFSEIEGRATIVVMQGTKFVNITAWHLGRFGPRQRQGFTELGRRVLEHALRASTHAKS